MSLEDDLERIVDHVLPTDPSFRRVEGAVMEHCIREARRSALEGSEEAFLWTAMRLLALADNGHTRLIPNDAISVLPLRFVSVGAAVHLVGAAPGTLAARGEVIAVNGTPVARIEAAAKVFLAGTPQRKRVIGAVLFAWPFALTQLGVSSGQSTTAYRVRDEAGRITDCEVENGHTVPASKLYPRNEHGHVDPAWAPERFVEITDWQGVGLSLVLPSFFDESERELPVAMSRAADRVRASPNRALLIDIRGNTGGDFLRTMPLIDDVCESADRRVAVLVDKFTFSAAIVFVAILKHRLGDRLTLIGEEMGDGLRFFAEGGLVELPHTGAAVRYSTAFHDWEAGTSDDTTPAEIARELVPAGVLEPDWEWTAGIADDGESAEFYQRVLRTLGE